MVATHPKILHRNPKEVREELSRLFTGEFRWGDSYTSLLLGLAVVIVISFLVLTFVKSTRSTSAPASEVSSERTERMSENENNAVVHTVVEGEGLWDIALRYYKTGDRWPEIAKANNLTENVALTAGQKIVVPSIQQKAANNLQENSITGNNYTVQEGDQLWQISLRAYGDADRWKEIYNANKLTSEVLVTGQTLTIPR